MDNIVILNKVNEMCLKCCKCALRKDRIQAVPGVGSPNAKVMIVGEAPGADEDKVGIPFCGRAGKLLNEMIIHAGEDRDNLFITNAVKCRPPENRDPQSNELDACWEYLYNQIMIIRPKVIIMVGRIASVEILSRLPEYQSLDFKITRDQGKFFPAVEERFQYYFNCMPILHPSYLLRGYKDAEIEQTIQNLRNAFNYDNDMIELIVSLEN